MGTEIDRSEVAAAARSTFTEKCPRCSPEKGEAMKTITTDSSTAIRMRSLLLQLARIEDEIATDEAAATPYWEPVPSSVTGHRGAAHALRAHADELLTAI
jgi:hypothetical protein